MIGFGITSEIQDNEIRTVCPVREHMNIDCNLHNFDWARDLTREI